MRWQSILLIAVVAVAAVAVTLRVPMIRGLVFGNGAPPA